MQINASEVMEGKRNPQTQLGSPLGLGRAEGSSAELRPPATLRHIRNPGAWKPRCVRTHPSSHLCPQGTKVVEPNP